MWMCTQGVSPYDQELYVDLFDETEMRSSRVSASLVYQSLIDRGLLQYISDDEGNGFDHSQFNRCMLLVHRFYHVSEMSYFVSSGTQNLTQFSSVLPVLYHLCTGGCYNFLSILLSSVYLTLYFDIMIKPA